MRLLIADDHPLFRVGLRAALEREGFLIVGEASDGQEALNLCMQLLPDGVVLDVRMPHMDGITAARMLREQRYLGLITLLTTFNEPVLVQQAALAGADAYWSKELPPEALAERLRRLSLGQEPRLRAPELPKLTAREQEVLQWMAQGFLPRKLPAICTSHPKPSRIIWYGSTRNSRPATAWRPSSGPVAWGC